MWHFKFPQFFIALECEASAQDERIIEVGISRPKDGVSKEEHRASYKGVYNLITPLDGILVRESNCFY